MSVKEIEQLANSLATTNLGQLATVGIAVAQALLTIRLDPLHCKGGK